MTPAILGSGRVRVDLPLIKTDQVIETIFLSYSTSRAAMVACADTGDVYHVEPGHVFLSWEDARDVVLGAIRDRREELKIRHHIWETATSPFPRQKDTSEESG